MEYVYCSGPLFCPEELGGMTAIANVLEEAGYGVFLPHRDGLEAYMMNMVNSPLNINLSALRDPVSRAIFALDVYQIVERCDYFVFNMNGRVPDEGGVAETAIAYSAGKPIVIYKNDSRTAFNGSDNSMVSSLADSARVSDIKKIPKAIKMVSDRFKKLGDSPYKGDNIPPVMRDTIKLGRNVWKVMNAIISKKDNGKSASDLVGQIAEVCRNHPGISDTEDHENPSKQG